MARQSQKCVGKFWKCGKFSASFYLPLMVPVKGKFHTCYCKGNLCRSSFMASLKRERGSKQNKTPCFRELNICQVNVKSFSGGKITWKIRDKMPVCLRFHANCVLRTFILKQFLARNSFMPFTSETISLWIFHETPTELMSQNGLVFGKTARKSSIWVWRIAFSVYLLHHQHECDFNFDLEEIPFFLFVASTSTWW